MMVGILLPNNYDLFDALFNSKYFWSFFLCDCELYESMFFYLCADKTLSISNEVYLKDEPSFDPQEYDQVCSKLFDLQGFKDMLQVKLLCN